MDLSQSLCERISILIVTRDTASLLGPNLSGRHWEKLQQTIFVALKIALIRVLGGFSQSQAQPSTVQNFSTFVGWLGTLGCPRLELKI